MMTLDMAISPGGRPADASPIGTPGGRKNWVDKAGGLPKYMRMIAHALMRKNPTWDAGRAIATAHEHLERLAATSKNPRVKAAAAAALAEWEAKKAKGRLSLAYADDPSAVVLDLAQLDDEDAMLVLDLAPGDYRPPYDWKHGYVPITPAAALSKAKGDRKRAAKLLGGRVRGGKIPVKRGRVAGEKRKGPKRGTFESGPNSRNSSNPSPRVAKALDDEKRGRGVPGELAAAKRAAAPKSPGPSDAEKIANAERMFGTGSPQHRAAQARFGGTPAKNATAPDAVARDIESDPRVSGEARRALKGLRERGELDKGAVWFRTAANAHPAGSPERKRYQAVADRLQGGGSSPKGGQVTRRVGHRRRVRGSRRSVRIVRGCRLVLSVHGLRHLSPLIVCVI